MTIEKNNQKSKIGILGAGGWALGLAVTLDHEGHKVTMWSKVKAELDAINNEHENKKSLPGVVISESISTTEDLRALAENNDILIMAVASPFVRSTSKEIGALGIKGLKIVNVAKGIEEGSLMTMTQIIESEVADCEVAVLSGPSHAEEVGRFLPTTCVIGAKSKELADYLQEIFRNDVFRVYTNPDILGIEIGGSLKNVMALAAGIADGLGYGDNTKAALITRGIHEIARLGVAMGGKLQTFYGLSGIGDLIVTCASMHSRNRRAGILIGQGKSMEEAMEEVKMVVEGVYSTKAAYELSQKYNIEMPIVSMVNKILFDHIPIGEVTRELMLRDPKEENYDLPWERL